MGFTNGDQVCGYEDDKDPSSYFTATVEGDDNDEVWTVVSFHYSAIYTYPHTRRVPTKTLVPIAYQKELIRYVTDYSTMYRMYGNTLRELVAFRRKTKSN